MKKPCHGQTHNVVSHHSKAISIAFLLSWGDSLVSICYSTFKFSNFLQLSHFRNRLRWCDSDNQTHVLLRSFEVIFIIAESGNIFSLLYFKCHFVHIAFRNSYYWIQEQVMWLLVVKITLMCCFLSFNRCELSFITESGALRWWFANSGILLILALWFSIICQSVISRTSYVMMSYM